MQGCELFLFFAFNTKMPIIAILASKDFTEAKKKVTSNGARPHDHWIKGAVNFKYQKS